jgi:hypothetical protein
MSQVDRRSRKVVKRAGHDDLPFAVLLQQRSEASQALGPAILSFSRESQQVETGHGNEL